MTKEFENYNCLASLLKTHCAKFKALLTFGTDGEFNLANEFFLSFLRESAVQSQEKELVKVVHVMEEFQFQASGN